MQSRSRIRGALSGKTFKEGTGLPPQSPRRRGVEGKDDSLPETCATSLPRRSGSRLCPPVFALRSRSLRPRAPRTHVRPYRLPGLRIPRLFLARRGGPQRGRGARARRGRAPSPCGGADRALPDPADGVHPATGRRAASRGHPARGPGRAGTPLRGAFDQRARRAHAAQAGLRITRAERLDIVGHHSLASGRMGDWLPSGAGCTPAEFEATWDAVSAAIARGGRADR